RGVASLGHLTMELLQSLTRIELLHVPYKGAPLAISAAPAGAVQMGVAAITGAIPLIQAKRLNPLAVTSGRLIGALPTIPTIAESSALIREGKLSPVELTRSLLDRIDRFDGELHAFITLTAEPALTQARAAEAEIAAGNYRGPMHGIPYALKDIYETAGIATT